METILAVALIETFLINAVTVIERRRRRILIHKWALGQMTLEELKTLKRQHWFAKEFPERVIPKEKKND